MDPSQWYSAVSVASGALAVAITVHVWRRSPNRRAADTFVTAMTFFLLAATFAYLLRTSTLDPTGSNATPLLFARMFYFFHMLAVGFTAAFIGSYFYGFQIMRRRGVNLFLQISILVVAILVAVQITDLEAEGTYGVVVATLPATASLATFATLYMVTALGALVRTAIVTRDRIVRRQALVMVAGVLTHGAVAEWYATSRIFLDLYPPPLLTLSALVMATFYAFAILRYRMFTVTPRAEEVMKLSRKFPIRPGRAYISKERRPELAFRALAEVVRLGDLGLVITRLPLKAVREDFDLETTPILSLSSTVGENVVPPTHPEILERLVSNFVAEQQRPVVALEGLEYLVGYVGFPRVLQTLHVLRDLVTNAGGVFVVSADPAALDERDQAVLERDYEPLPFASAAGFTVQDVFVIHSSGILVSHAGRTEAPKPGAPDQDVMAGMLTAIMNFARVSFAEASHELKGFDLGSKKVVIERGNRIIVAVVFLGSPPASIAEEMRAFISRAERKFGIALDNWSGSMDEMGGIRAMTTRLLI